MQKRRLAKLISLQHRLRQRRLLRGLLRRFTDVLPQIITLQRWWSAIRQRRLYLALREATRKSWKEEMLRQRRANMQAQPLPLQPPSRTLPLLTTPASPRQSNKAIGQLLQLGHYRLPKLRRFWFPYELLVHDPGTDYLFLVEVFQDPLKRAIVNTLWQAHLALSLP